MIKLVDLSQDLYHGVPNFACDPQTAIFTHLVITDRGYNNAVIVTGTHQGTHMDAPYHFFDDGKTIDQLDIKKAGLHSLRFDTILFDYQDGVKFPISKTYCEHFKYNLKK